MSDLRARLVASLSTIYRLERELGSGGMAVVYLAHDLRNKRRVALKVLRPEISAVMGPDRFLREIETLANLTHPHILPLHDSGEADGLLYYVMPYVEGESLRDWLLREKQLPLDDALRIAREVADALSHAHARGVIHRDIKPENILLSGGHALVADFGIAAAIDVAGGSRLTETGIAMGTPAYMSPEQALGERTIDARVDIYALGCVLYEMLAGEPPFSGPTAQAIVARRLQEPVPSLRKIRELVPEAIDQTVTKALARLPADRFATAERFADAMSVQGAVSGDTSSPSNGRWGRRQIVTLVGAVAALGVAFTAWMVERDDVRLDPSRVAVASFENRAAGDSLFGAILTDAISNGLTRAGFVVVPSTRVMGIRAAMAHEQLPFDVMTLGRETGAGLIVTGSYFTRGDTLHIQPQLVDIRIDVQAAIDPVVVPGGDQQVGIQAALDRAMIALSSRAHPLLAKSTALIELPTSMEAYRAYIIGFERYFTRDQARARDEFYRAVALDSTFVSALTWAALTEWGLGSNVPRVDSLLKIVERKKSRLLPFDRASLEYLRAWVDGRVEDAYRAAVQRADIGGPGWNVFAVQGALRANRVNEAYDRIRKTFEAPLGGQPPRRYMADVQHARGKYRRELRETRKSSKEKWDESLLLKEIRALAALGRFRELRERLDLARNNGSTARGSIYREAAAELRAHGFSAQADTFGYLAARWYRETVADSPTWNARFELAATLADLAMPEADTILQALVSEGLPLPYGGAHFRGDDAAALGYLGISAAARGDTRRADEIIARLGNLQRDYLFGANLHWQARIAAQLGQCARAVDYLDKAYAKGSSYQVAGAVHLREVAQLRKLKGCRAYEDFIKPKG